MPVHRILRTSPTPRLEGLRIGRVGESEQECMHANNVNDHALPDYWGVKLQRDCETVAEAKQQLGGIGAFPIFMACVCCASTANS